MMTKGINNWSYQNNNCIVIKLSFPLISLNVIILSKDGETCWYFWSVGKNYVITEIQTQPVLFVISQPTIQSNTCKHHMCYVRTIVCELIISKTVFIGMYVSSSSGGPVPTTVSIYLQLSPSILLLMVPCRWCERCWTRWGGSVFELKPDRPWHLHTSLCHRGLPMPKEEEGYLAPFQLYLFNHIVPPIQSPVFSSLWPHCVSLFMTDRDFTLCSPPGGVLKRSHHIFRRWFCSCLTSKMPQWLRKSDRKQ